MRRLDATSVEAAVSWLKDFFRHKAENGGALLWSTSELCALWPGKPDLLEAALYQMRDAKRGPRLVCTDGFWWQTTSKVA